MSWSGHYTFEPSDLESRFAIEDGMAYLDSIFTEPSEESKGLIDKVLSIMESLPEREADFVDLYYFRRLKQTDIAGIFGVSQPTVCYRLQRATARIQFLLQRPSVDLEALGLAMWKLLPDRLDAQIMVLMNETTCQSEVAKRLGISQGKVRHRFLRSLAKMRGKTGYEVYVQLFEFVAANLNILREVQRPAWEGRVSRVLL